MKEPLFSIIIPVYNVENYLEACLDGILNQTFKDFEIILIDDGSTDNCKNLCDFYLKFTNVKVLHKKNGGLSSARNTGLKIANGTYVIFLDSDDYWDNNNALNLLNERIQTFRNDVILFGYKKIYLDSNYIEYHKGNFDIDYISSEKDKSKILENLFITNQFPGSAWMMCVKRDLLISNNITFPENVTSEDIIWINKVLVHSHSIGAIGNSFFYNYVNNRTGQITSKSTIAGCKGMLLGLKYWRENINKFEYKAISKQMAHVCQVLLMHFSNLSKLEREKIKQEVLDELQILKHGGFKEKVSFALVKSFNLRLVGCLIKYLYFYQTKLKRIKYDISRNN